MAQDWPLWGHLLARVVNELQGMRGDLWALIARESFTFKPLLPPSAERAQQAKRDQVRAAHDDMMAQLRGQKR